LALAHGEDRTKEERLAYVSGKTAVLTSYLRNGYAILAKRK
jgi:hypothetical protein